MLHSISNGVDDSRGVTSSDVKVEGLASLLTNRDDINGDATSRPNIVEVDTCGHDRDQNVVRAKPGDFDDLWLESSLGIAKSLAADNLGVHLVGYLANGRQLANVNKSAHVALLSRRE
jgi:hypothetical protein